MNYAGSTTFWRLAAALLLAAGVLAPPSEVRADDAPTFRDLVRKYVTAQVSAVKAEPLPGLPEELQKVVALEYTVLLRDGENETPVDAETHMFKIGDKIRVRIEPLSDLYIYIFTEGASGERKCLLPEGRETSPLAKQGELLDLPTDGFIEFVPPAGEEKLIVVATDAPSDDLAALADVVFKKPDEELTDEQKAIQKKLKARTQKTLKSIRERQEQGTRYRGLFGDDELKKVGSEVESEGAAVATLVEPPHGDETSTFSMAASFKKEGRGELYVTIPLKSVADSDNAENR